MITFGYLFLLVLFTLAIGVLTHPVVLVILMFGCGIAGEAMMRPHLPTRGLRMVTVLTAILFSGLILSFLGVIRG